MRGQCSLACALFDRGTGASRDALGEIANLSFADRDKALTHLQRLFLVNRTDTDRFWVLPIVQRYASDEFADRTVGHSIVDRWLEWLAFVSQAYGRDLEWNANHADFISQEYTNLVAAVRLCNEQKRWLMLFQISEGGWHCSYLMGLFNEMEELLAAAGAAAFEMNDEEKQGVVDLYQGRLLGVRGQYDEALLYLERAEDRANKYGKKYDLGVIWATRSSALYSVGKSEAGGQLALKLIGLAEEVGDLYLKTLAADRVSRYEADHGRFREAAEWVTKGKLWAKELGSERRLAAILHREASNLVKRKQGGRC